MAALFAEMNLFVTKLTQLNSYGMNACLNFNAYGGRVYVSLHAELGGDLETEDYTQARKMPEPSSLRRRIRRRQAFRNTCRDFVQENETRNSDEADPDVLSNACETNLSDDVADSFTVEKSEPSLLIDFNQEVPSESYLSDSCEPQNSSLSQQEEAKSSPQQVSSSSLPPPQQLDSLQIELQMHSMLKYLTSRM